MPNDSSKSYPMFAFSEGADSDTAHSLQPPSSNCTEKYEFIEDISMEIMETPERIGGESNYDNCYCAIQ